MAARPRFCAPITEILLCLADSAWAGGDLAGWAKQLGSKSKSEARKDSLSADDLPCIAAEGNDTMAFVFKMMKNIQNVGSSVN